MSDFISVLTHGRKLQGAVKELSIEELHDVASKLARIIENREKKEAEAKIQAQAKKAKIEQLRQQIEDAGLDLADFEQFADSKPAKKTGKKRPIKYSIKDKDGNVTNWTGIGRMPLVFADAMKQGKKLDSFKI
ncbi:H-NS family nucleoid-associated regulatory protein [Neptunicella sp. SCSIO 80796]|uniref:H-NS histone family protein n=1 Tax=Neptunicella plasticusilytica TaxID=3117012 RepID=UPI003A4D4711